MKKILFFSVKYQKMDLTLLLIVILGTLLLTFFICDNIKKPPNFPPGPFWLPVVGNSLLIKQLSIIHGGFHKALISLSNKYNTKILGLKLGSDLFVVVFSKDLIKHVFTQEEFQGRPDSYFIRLRTMGSRKGITMTDGSFWQEQRSFAVRHLRSVGFGKSHMESLIIEELQDFIKRVSSGGKTVALSNQLPSSVINVLWALTAGSRFQPADPQLARLLELMAARSRAFDMAGGILSQMPLLARLTPNWSGYNLICSLNIELKNLLVKTIEDHRKSLNLSETRDFIDAFLQQMLISKDHLTTFSEEQLVMVCLDFFIAGSQTTSNTLCFALLNMILYQDIQHKVYKEISEVLGSRTVPNLEDRCRLPFVEAVLLESQRFLHVVPVAGPRRVLCNTVLDNYKIPKDATVLLSLYSLHHDEDTWDDPMKFWPERFLNKKNGKLLSEELFQFGIGKRRCLGEALAKNFVFLFFTGILRSFCLEAPDKDIPPSSEPIPGITLCPKPYNVLLTPRES